MASVILVTGGASGMGLATATTMFNAGYYVVMVDLSQNALDSAIENISPNTDRLIGIAADVSKQEQVEKAFAAVEKLGKLSGIAHCAGILGKMGPAHEASAADWAPVLNVNIMGTIIVATAAIKLFRQQGSPPPSGYSIVCIGSHTAARPQANHAVYASTKGAVRTLVHALAKENAEAGIRINTVNPGGIETAMTKAIVERRGNILPADLVPLRRWGTAQEIANMVEFLLSDKSAFITGSDFDVDGGRNS